MPGPCLPTPWIADQGEPDRPATESQTAARRCDHFDEARVTSSGMGCMWSSSRQRVRAATRHRKLVARRGPGPRAVAAHAWPITAESAESVGACSAPSTGSGSRPQSSSDHLRAACAQEVALTWREHEASQRDGGPAEPCSARRGPQSAVRWEQEEERRGDRVRNCRRTRRTGGHGAESPRVDDKNRYGDRGGGGACRTPRLRMPGLQPFVGRPQRRGRQAVERARTSWWAQRRTAGRRAGQVLLVGTEVGRQAVEQARTCRWGS